MAVGTDFSTVPCFVQEQGSGSEVVQRVLLVCDANFIVVDHQFSRSYSAMDDQSASEAHLKGSVSVGVHLKLNVGLWPILLKNSD